MHNIEKSGFHRGQYVGYGGNVVWRIRKSDGGWVAVQHNPPGPGYERARTLREMSSKLDAMTAPMKNPRPRIGAAKPTRASSATGMRPSKRLVSRRKANTRKGYFPNPAEVARAHKSKSVAFEIQINGEWRMILRDVPEPFASDKAMLKTIAQAISDKSGAPVRVRERTSNSR